jgi:hypothetical protein
MKPCFIDFEFNKTTERDLNLVCASALCYVDGVEVMQRRFWLLGTVGQRRNCLEFLNYISQAGYTLVAYAAEAEARSILTIDPAFKRMPVIDLYLEYRQLLNHDHALAYGDQLIGGEVRRTTPPKSKWDVGAEGDDEDHSKAPANLAAACFKLLGVKIDTAEKEAVRALIIAGDSDAINAEADRIQAYCDEDVRHLPALLKAVIARHVRRSNPKEQWLAEALQRGEYAWRTAVMVRHGYPVDVPSLGRFKANVGEILKSAAEECNAASDLRPFRWNKKELRYSLNEKAMRDFIAAQGLPYWRQTEKRGPSLSKEAFGDWFDGASPGLGGAYYRYVKAKQSLNGFLPGAKKKFDDYLGSDGRVRPYFGIYGSQSSRSQPGAAGFIPLKSHWMRVFIKPPKGRAIVSMDYASQEFLIAAVLSQDAAMMDAYRSGDVYLAFAKAAKLAPADATKESHKAIRDKCKGLVLGISYDMTAKGLAPRLKIDEAEAQKLIDTFYDTYPDYAEWKSATISEYETEDELRLPDGWRMYGDNDNIRSVGNFPVQGFGAVVMRKAVAIAQDAGLDVIYTLHDSIVAEIPCRDFRYAATLRTLMQEAFGFYAKDYGEFPMIRVDGDIWSPEYGKIAGAALLDGVKIMTEYVDEKGAADLARYRQFI